LHLFHHSRRCLAHATLAGLFALSTTACRESIVALGGAAPAGAAARARAELAFWALGARVTDPARDAKYESARAKIADAALLPGRVFNDTSVWNAGSVGRRTLLIGGAFTGGRYRLDAARSVPWPDQPADSRHVINLHRLGDGEYAWDTDVAYAIGSVTARDVGAFWRALLASAEGREEREVRQDYRAVTPRFAATLGQLFRVDSIRTSHLADTSTLATFHVTMTPEVLARRYPNFAEYMDRYFASARMRWTLTNRAGAQFLYATMHDGRIQFRVRTKQGRVIGLAGTALELPDSLVLHGDMAMKVRLFTVGIRNYQAAFTLIRDDRETGFRIVSREEPHWVLPLITERLLRTPLRRPFQGQGAMFAMTVRDTAGAQTILLRSLHLEVQESAILRFIGRLSSIAVGDFAGKVEKEELAFFREVFAGLVADTQALR